jgi:hypothetical protein
MVWASPDHSEDFLVLPFRLRSRRALRDFATCLDEDTFVPGRSAAQAVSIPPSPGVLIKAMPRFLMT